MIKEAIILSGGKGTNESSYRLNKQLLPIHDKPLIYYPSILMLAKIKDILIVVNKGELNQLKKYFRWKKIWDQDPIY